MKILIATGIYSPEIGGPATYAQLLFQELPKRSIEVELLLFRDVRKFPRIIRHFVYFVQIILKGKKCDIIFSQDPVSTGLPSVLAGKIIRKKVILRVAGDYAWEQASQRFGVTDSIDEFQNRKYGIFVNFFKAIQSFSVKHADLVITPSNYFTGVVSRWVSNKQQVITIYNGIDLSLSFKKTSKFKDKTIITAGRLVPWKGFDVLIRLLKHIPEWRLMIVGSGDDRERLEKIMHEEKVQDRVVFLGQLTRTDLFEYIYKSNIFILASDFESFSFQVVESMHVGTPVIVKNIGNLSEIIRHEENGILIDNLEKETVIKYLNLLENDIVFRGKLIKQASEDAKKFSIDSTVDSLVNSINMITRNSKSCEF